MSCETPIIIMLFHHGISLPLLRLARPDMRDWPLHSRSTNNEATKEPGRGNTRHPDTSSAGNLWNEPLSRTGTLCMCVLRVKFLVQR